MNYSDHKKVLGALDEAMEDDHDNRERARESEKFLSARDGQWEPEWAEAAKDKPRYTFDMIEPVRDQIMGDIAQSDFDVRVVPSGGEASEDIADTYNGLLRAIKARSNSEAIYRRLTRKMVTSGFDVARVVAKYCDGDSFDQDLAVEAIPNAIDRVWFGYHNEPDASDAMHCWIMTGLPEADYKEKYPDTPAASIDNDRQASVFFHKPGLVMVGELIFLKEEKQTLVQMNNGAVYTDDEDFQALKDELEEAGIVEKDRRDRDVLRCYSRRFNADDWIDKKPRPMPFKHRLPVVPLYGSFDIVDEKLIYRGFVEKLIDPQRVMNYSLSREIEEGALAPRAKTWMTLKQAAGHGDSLATLNTNTDPVQFYTPDPDAPGTPQQQGGAQINPGLRNISQAMREMIGMAAGMFAANMGDNPGLQSGVAIDNLQDRGDRANNKYLEAREVFERGICKSLISAIPEIYEPDRQVRLMSQDGTVQVATIGQIGVDFETKRQIVLHDVSRGAYEVIVTSAPSFKTRQSETVASIVEIAKADPSVIQMGGDILLSNIPAPGMDDLAARKRLELFNANLIPPDQMTPDEQQRYEQIQSQPQEESPDMVLARAEQAKADAEAQKAQADFVSEQNKAQQIANDFKLEAQKLANESGRLQLDAFIAENDANLKGLEGRKIFAEVALTIAKAEEIEAGTDATVTRIDDLINGSIN